MTKTEFEKHVSCIMSMGVDVLGGGITQETFISNLSLIAEILENGSSEQKDPQ